MTRRTPYGYRSFYGWCLLWSCICSALLLPSCTPRYAMINESSFVSVADGATLAELEAMWGQPVFVRDKIDGSEEVEYIEKVIVQGRVIRQNHYVFVLVNQSVVGRYLFQTEPPAYEELLYLEDPNHPNYRY